MFPKVSKKKKDSEAGGCCLTNPSFSRIFMVKLPANPPVWKVGDRWFEAHSGLQVSKKPNVSSPLTRDDSILWGVSVTEG